MYCLDNEPHVKNVPLIQDIPASDRNSRTGNEEREIRAGRKISRTEREKAGN